MTHMSVEDQPRECDLQGDPQACDPSPERKVNQFLGPHEVGEKVKRVLIQNQTIEDALESAVSSEYSVQRNANKRITIPSPLKKSTE